MSDNRRLFVAIEVDDRIRQQVAELSGRLTASCGAIRWVAKENLHLTLKFLGPVEAAKVPLVTAALAATLATQERFSIGVKGLGVFPNPERSRVLWAGLHGAAIRPLVKLVEDGLEPLGFDRAERSFRPHLTLGRWRIPVKDPARVRSMLAGRDNDDFGEFVVNQVRLLHSTLYPTGPVYSVIESFPLTSGAVIAV